MNSLSEYVEGVETTLQRWLDLHTNPKIWADDWSLGEIRFAYESSKGILSNSYFNFNWKESSIKLYAKKFQRDFQYCKTCGCLNDGYDCCENPKLKQATVAQISEWLLDDCEFQAPEYILMESLEVYGFREYRNGVKDVVAPVISEIKDVLKSIRKAKTNEDKLEAVLWGTRVYHVHGNVMQDYGMGEISYNLVDSIRDNGLNSVFSREEIEEYLKQE